MSLSSRIVVAILAASFCSPSFAADVVHTYTARTDAILNPERGLYAFSSLDTSINFNVYRGMGYTTVYTPLDLSAFRTQNISTAKLADISATFANMKSAGVKGIVRIVYNYDSSGLDATLAQMEQHLIQLEPIFAANVESIAFFQAGLIGAWGEWHSSSNGLDNPAGRLAVWNLLKTYLPASRMIAIRTPGYVYELEGGALPLLPNEAFAQTPESRIAHHNDCWLSTETDMGTYTSASDRESWLTTLETDTKYVPWGGETCPNGDGDPGDRADCFTAISELERLHAAYLNADYHGGSIDQLNNETSILYPSGCWDEIGNRLGYRLELIQAVLPSELEPDADFGVSVSMQNVGFGPIYNERPVFVRLLSGSTVVQDYEIADWDPRRWLPELGTIDLATTLTAPSSLPEGPFSLALWMPDLDSSLRSDSAYSVQFANTGVWDVAEGHNILASGITLNCGGNPNPKYATITIDGDMSDWSGIPVAYTDPTGDHLDAEFDVISVSVANDADFLYFRIQTANSLDFMGSNKGNIYIDTDFNGATGFHVGSISGFGSELLIQSGAAYDQRGGGWNEGAVDNEDFQKAGSGGDWEYRISRSAVYASDSAAILPGEPIAILLDSQNSSYVSREFAPDASGYEYATFASCTTPVPVGLAMFIVD